MLVIDENLRIPDAELHWSYARSSGPGGQNVNKVASKALLRWDLLASPSVPEEVKARLRTQLGRKLTPGGEVLLTSQRFRDQERNRQDCLDKLRALLELAAKRPKTRRETRPSRSSKVRRVEAKKRHAAIKKGRRQRSTDGDG